VGNTEERRWQVALWGAHLEGAADHNALGVAGDNVALLDVAAFIARRGGELSSSQETAPAAVNVAVYGTAAGCSGS
jgi:hypothetical protein